MPFTHRVLGLSQPQRHPSVRAISPGGHNLFDPGRGRRSALCNERNRPVMQVKWKHLIARLVPTATMVAAVVTTIVAHTGNVKWG